MSAPVECERRDPPRCGQIEVGTESGKRRLPVFVGLDGITALVEQNHAIGTTRPVRQGDFQQLIASLQLANGQSALDPTGRRHDQGHALAVVGFRKPGYVDHAQDFTVVGMTNDVGGTGPTFDARAVMLGGVNLHGVANSQRGANGVSAAHVLAPGNAGQ